MDSYAKTLVAENLPYAHQFLRGDFAGGGVLPHGAGDFPDPRSENGFPDHARFPGDLRDGEIHHGASL